MSDGGAPVESTGRQAVVAFPEQVNRANAEHAGARLIAAISEGAAVVIADMSRTTSCDQAGTDALLHAYQRALLHNAELRLVAAAAPVRRALTAEGLDRLVPVYPALDTARTVPNWTRPNWTGPTGAGQASPTGSGSPEPAAQPTVSLRSGPDTPPVSVGLTAVMLRQLIDALRDGVALTDESGVIVLANRQLTGMFGYEPGELAGQAVDVLVPAELRMAHRHYRAAYSHEPSTRPMGERVRLVGLRKDGGTVPVTITLSPVPTADRLLILAVVRAPAPAQRQDDLADLARAAADRADQAESLLDRVVRGLFHVGLSLQAAADQPADLARDRISEALHRLDDTIHDIRGHIFRAQEHDGRADRS
jgi:PAS domain S-box-containing protein